MESKLMELSCESFATHVAAKESVPGGGAVSAYVGALGVALGSMVANFTTGKAAYSHVEDDIQRILARAEEVRVRLLELADEDAEAFYPLSQAFALPKDEPQRAVVIEKATKAAIIAPFGMVKMISEALDLLEELAEKGSRMLLSDVGCGAALCKSALESAALNVFINTSALNDKVYAQSIEAECDQLLHDYLPKAERIYAQVMNTIRGGETS